VDLVQCVRISVSNIVENMGINTVMHTRTISSTAKKFFETDWQLCPDRKINKFNKYDLSPFLLYILIDRNSEFEYKNKTDVKIDKWPSYVHAHHFSAL
jgi:hypothetical protein